MEPTVVFIATYDTKGVEAEYIKKRIEAYGSACLTVDVGVGGEPAAVPDVSLDELCAGNAKDTLLGFLSHDLPYRYRRLRRFFVSLKSFFSGHGRPRSANGAVLLFSVF